MEILHGQRVSDWPGGTYTNFQTVPQVVGDPPASPTQAAGDPAASTAQSYFDQQDPNYWTLMGVMQTLKQGRGVAQANINRLNSAYGGNFDVASALGISPDRIIPNGAPVEAYDSTSYGPNYGVDYSENLSTQQFNDLEQQNSLNFSRSMGQQWGQSLDGVNNQDFLNDLSGVARYGMGSMPENYDPATQSVDYRAPGASHQGITDFLNGGGRLSTVEYGTPFTPQQQFSANQQQSLPATQPQQQAPTTGGGLGGFGGFAGGNLSSWGQMAYNGASAANNGFQSGYPTNVSPIYNPNPNGATPRNGFGGPLGNNNPWAPTF